MLIISIALLIAGFIVLIIGADKLIDGASALAKKYRIPDIVIGLTIVAFGTSAPELAINVVAAIRENSDLVLGNVIGSNIFNVLAILGISALIAPLPVNKNTARFEIPFSLFAGVMVLLLACDHIWGASVNKIGRIDGIILLIFFIIFLGYNFYLIKTKNETLNVETKIIPLWKSLLLIVVGLAGLVVGGRLIVDNAVKIAAFMGISERIIALTIVSVGTSLPELAASIAAVRKKEVDIAIGNVVGSNIFNIFLVLGLSTCINETVVIDNSFIDIFMNILAGLLLWVFCLATPKRGTPRWENLQLKSWTGFIFVILYVAYIMLLILDK